MFGWQGRRKKAAVEAAKATAAGDAAGLDRVVGSELADVRTHLASLRACAEGRDTVEAVDAALDGHRSPLQNRLVSTGGHSWESTRPLEPTMPMPPQIQVPATVQTRRGPFCRFALGRRPLGVWFARR